ncbi:GIY-YIG nuclease family protein [Janibacter sp. GXQ6167]|uniref:GIY-YIG nuclease family protein n=1 Tax=Janibacter sp. GXQ6167 TaxID=3240791 RepID=UPI003523E56C
MSGKHIELFLVDGIPGGITTAEIAGWTGHVLSGPRTDIADILRRDEAERNGAYLLLGDDADAIGGVRGYIGRTETFTRRFKDHQLKKDWWDRVVLVTAKDDGFNEGHWGYLEARLVELATSAQRITLDNTQSPVPRKLSEAQRSDMEAFLANLHIILPVLGINAIRQRPAAKPTIDPTPIESPVFTISQPKTGIEARGIVDGDEFVVLEGSRVVAAWTRTGTSDSTKRAYEAYGAAHAKLVADGSVVVDGKIGRLTRDVPFTSPSTAGSIVLGRSCNGRVSWLWEGGTFATWADRDLDGSTT